jgi:hypothetical protein|tara:strand:- start:66 stop:263 length:198 start_codon:yes stop_codon:yes gene_type:complete
MAYISVWYGLVECSNTRVYNTQIIIKIKRKYFVAIHSLLRQRLIYVNKLDLFEKRGSRSKIGKAD